MPLSNFTRPVSPYANNPLPRINKFRTRTRADNKPIPDEWFDDEANASVDRDNELDRKIEDVQAGIITGSDNPLNAGKFPTTNGVDSPTISWVKVTNNNIDDGALDGNKITPSTIGTEQLDNGIITPDKVPDDSIPYSKMDFNNGDIPYATINVPDGAIGYPKLNIPDGTIPGGKITTNKSINQNQLALLSVGTPELIDDCTTLAKLAQEVLDRLVPIGTIIAFAGSSGLPVSDLWLECNNQAVSRVTYANLFANIGTAYGSGDGTTTFNVPDLRGRVAVGIGSDNSTNGRVTTNTAPNIILGGYFGEERHQLTIAETASHQHQLNCLKDSGGGTAPLWSSGLRGTSLGGFPTQPIGGDQPHNNMQPSIFMRYYIRAL
jgi:microcystin-dependent protein